MRRLAVIVLPLLVLPLAAMQVANVGDSRAIHDVLQRTYVEGLYVERDPDLLQEGLAANFVMQVYWDGKLSTRTRAQWLERLQLDRVRTDKHVKSDIRVLDITGVAAVARVDIYVDDRHKYTDYVGLYKTDPGWQIVTKMFHAYE